MSVVLICLLGVPLTLSQLYGSPEVQTKLGAIRGLYKTSYNGRIFSSFEGIPYAEPPIGENRFKPARERQPWKGVWNATYLHICAQLFQGITIGEEDCLYLSVHVPRINPTPGENLNVLVLVHGGAFMWGGCYTGAEYLMDKDLIYVCPNYRLGPLGFLDTEDGAVTANNGMRDEVLALQWIKKHIRNFGGNPDSVTLLGYSSGASGVDFLSISPMAKGLFHRAIAGSGSSLNPWTLQKYPAKRAKHLADLVGCSAITTKEMVECLRSIPVKKLIYNVKHLYALLGDLPFSPFAPTVEWNVRDGFLPYHPLDLLVNGQASDVPFIFSVTTEEGTYPGAALSSILDKVEENWEDILPLILSYNDTVYDSDKKEIAKLLKNSFLNGKKLSSKNVFDFMQLLGERHFRHGVEKSARLHAIISKYPVYMYVLGYRSTKKIHLTYSNSTEDYGTGHGSDVIYIFPIIPLGPLTYEEVQMKDFYLDFIDSFCRSGRPHLKEWTPLDFRHSNDLTYLKIVSPSNMYMQSAAELSNTAIWDSLYFIEYILSKRQKMNEK